MANKKQCYCVYCQRLVAADLPTGISDGWGCILTIFTGGLFLPLWIILALINSMEKPMCPVCGSTDLRRPGSGVCDAGFNVPPFAVVMMAIIALAVIILWGKSL